MRNNKVNSYAAVQIDLGHKIVVEYIIFIKTNLKKSQIEIEIVCLIQIKSIDVTKMCANEKT